MKPRLTWEQAVHWLRDQPDQCSLVRACYYDDPLVDAAERFYRSGEWAATRQLLPDVPGRALDLGAGRGISSLALVCDGWTVVALEPDPSPLVGTGAIRTLGREARKNIEIVAAFSDELPFEPTSFDLVYGRQVMHHARDLDAMCREVAAVLRPGGRFVAAREHVISRPEDLEVFLATHPLHNLYGGEHAYTLDAYVVAITRAGLTMKTVLGSLDSPINYFPMSASESKAICQRPLARRLGTRMTAFLTSARQPVGRFLGAHLARRASAADTTPGRMYTFVAHKPRSRGAHDR